MSFALGYSGPPRPIAAVPETATDVEDVVWALAAAGAFASLDLEEYSLGLGGGGVVELMRGCADMIWTLGERTAADQAWVFASFGSQLPVITFAIDADWITIHTRTHAEEPGAPLVVLAGRDLVGPVRVPRHVVLDQCRGFLARCLADVDHVCPGAPDTRGYRAASLGAGPAARGPDR